MLTLIAAPANSERGPRYMERALAAIHQSGMHDPIVLLYAEVAGQIGLLVRCETSQKELVLGPIAASYPHCTLTEMEEELENGKLDDWSVDLHLVPELFPILRHAQFEDLLNGNFADPITGLLRSIMPNEDACCSVEIEIVPASHRRVHAAIDAVKTLDREFFRHHHKLAHSFSRNATSGNRLRRGRAWLMGLYARRTPSPTHSTLDTSTSRLHEREDDLQAAADKIGSHLFDASIRLVVKVARGQETIARHRLQSMIGAFGAFTKSRLARFQPSPVRRGRNRPRKPAFLAIEELATLWHPPTASASAQKMKATEFAELEAPTTFHAAGEEGSVLLGRVRFRDDHRGVTLALEDRRRHLYIVGKTGMGKTTMLQNLILADMEAGRGLCVVDPHGDLAETLVGLVPRHRTNDVILFDAANRDAVVGFNPLACHDPHRIDQVTSGVVSAFKKLHDSWGPRLEDTLRNAVFAEVERGGTLMSVMQLLGEKPYRERAVLAIRDDVVRSFWMHEFASWSDNYRTEAVAAIQNKIRPFLTNTVIRAIVSAPGAGLDLRAIMDGGKVLVANLSKGRMGEDNSMLLGAFLVTSIQQAAMTRADVPEANRRDFLLYVDEFQNFTTGSFASVLSEARKYRLSLIVAHQYLAQLDDETADAVWGNVGSIVAFQVGSTDAELLARQLAKFAGQIGPENLTNLPKYTAYSRLLLDGLPSNPFSMESLPPAAFDPERAEIVRRVSQRRFSNYAV